MYINDEDKCIVCGAPLPEKCLLRFENMPASAQDIPDEVQIKNEHGIELSLYQCDSCGLVQFNCPPVSYYRDVIRSGGFSTTMVELRRNQYSHFINNYHLRESNILEVGCGQGEFLAVLEEFNVNAFGIEHKEGLVKLARSKGLKVWEDFAEDKNTSLKDPYQVGKYDAFLSFNFLEHQPNPKGMLDCIYNQLTDEGIGLVTVPSLEYILEHNGYYELIRDHLAYYSFETLENLFIHAGFEVLEKKMINRDTLSFIVKKARTNYLTQDQIKVKNVEISGLNKSLVTIKDEISELIKKAVYQKYKIAIWGASHQGFTLAATTELKKNARYIIDSAPFKQGRFAPASHLPIVAPDYFFEDPVDIILIVAPGYTNEIAKIIENKFGEKVQILVLKTKHIEKYID